jgi:uncharacterized protein (DUF2267 family)
MQHDEFIGRVQHRAQLASRGDAERITRIVLEAISEQMPDVGASHLAAQLPTEIGRHLIGNVKAGRLTVDEFYRRIGIRERLPLDQVQRHVHAVLDVVGSAVSPGVVAHARAQLPKDYAVLFSLPGTPERVDEEVRRNAFACRPRDGHASHTLRPSRTFG